MRANEIRCVGSATMRNIFSVFLSISAAGNSQTVSGSSSVAVDQNSNRCRSCTESTFGQTRRAADMTDASTRLHHLTAGVCIEINSVGERHLFK